MCSKAAPRSGSAAFSLRSICFRPCRCATPKPSPPSPLFSDTCSPSGSTFAAAKASQPALAFFSSLRRWAALASIGLLRRVLLSPAMSRSPPSSAPPAFPSLPGFLFTASEPPFFIAAQIIVASAHHPQAPPEHPPPCSPERNPLRRSAERKPHEPHRYLRFRRMGNRHRALARTVAAATRSLSGRTALKLAQQIIDAGENTLSFPAFRFPPITVTARLRGHHRRRHRRLRHPLRVPAPHSAARPRRICTTASSSSAPPRALKTTPSCA